MFSVEYHKLNSFTSVNRRIDIWFFFVCMNVYNSGIKRVRAIKITDNVLYLKWKINLGLELCHAHLRPP